MQILILSDLHISKNTPWSRDWEDIDWLIRQLTDLRGRMGIRFPCFQGAVLCGDMFNSPRILPGDAVRLASVLRALGVADKPIGWINGNHDTGDFNVAEILPGAVNLNKEALFGLVRGCNFSQNILEVREWLKGCDADVTVTHQSASMFMKFGESLRGYQILDKQLHSEDFHAPVNFIGDTHITDVFTKDNVNCISPGILIPMRSRKELFESAPQIMVWDIPKDGSGDWDVENSSISTIPLKKRPYVNPHSQLELDNFDWKSSAEDGIPVLVFVPAGVRKELDFSKYVDYSNRIIEYSENVEVEEVLDAPLADRAADTIDDIMMTATELIPEDTPNKGDVLELTRGILTVEDPDVIVKSYLEDK